MSERPTQHTMCIGMHELANSTHEQEVLELAEDIWGGKISVHQMPKFIALSAKLRAKDAATIAGMKLKYEHMARQEANTVWAMLDAANKEIASLKSQLAEAQKKEEIAELNSTVDYYKNAYFYLKAECDRQEDERRQEIERQQGFEEGKQAGRDEVLNDLDFEPDEHHTVSDMANAQHKQILTKLTPPMSRKKCLTM